MKKEKIINIVWDGIMVLSIFLAIRWYYVPGNIDAIGSTGVQSFRYFTTDSNLMMMIATIMWMVVELKNIVNEKMEVPKWVRIFRYAATTAGTLTLLEVMLFMSPMAFYFSGIKGIMRCYEGNVFVLHFSAPIMMILSFVFSDKEYKPEKKEAICSMLPIVLYGLVYFSMVVVCKRWPDFYSFTFKGRYILVPIVAIVILLSSYGIATVLRKLKIIVSNIKK